MALALLAILGIFVLGLSLPQSPAASPVARTASHVGQSLLRQADPSAELLHPKAAEKVYVDMAHPHFVAFGTSKNLAGAKVEAYIKHKDDADIPRHRIMATALVMRPRAADPKGMWAVQFTFPRTNPPEVGAYILKVRFRDKDNNIVHVADPIDFEIKEVTKKPTVKKDLKKSKVANQKEKYGYGILTIQYPTTGSTVSTSFWAYGTDASQTSPNSITLTATRSGGGPWTGQGLANGSTWMGYMSVPAGTGTTIDGVDSDGNTDVVSPFTVQ